MQNTPKTHQTRHKKLLQAKGEPPPKTKQTRAVHVVGIGGRLPTKQGKQNHSEPQQRANKHTIQNLLQRKVEPLVYLEFFVVCVEAKTVNILIYMF